MRSRQKNHNTRKRTKKLIQKAGATTAATAASTTAATEKENMLESKCQADMLVLQDIENITDLYGTARELFLSEVSPDYYTDLTYVDPSGIVQKAGGRRRSTNR